MAGDPAVVRDARPGDAAACAAIYRPYVLDTSITFEIDPPSTEQMQRRIDDVQTSHAWMVLVQGGVVVGYAYAHPFHTRAAYRWTCEVSVYLESGRARRGGGRALYTVLLDRLVARGFRTAVAGMTLPNPASVGLHRAMGFQAVGTAHQVGWKHGAWRDVAWMERRIGAEVDPPAEPA